MKIPLSYVARNLWARRLTTTLTGAGLALVVFVFATVLMLDEGLRNTMVTTGEYDNVILIRRSADTEVQSGVDRTQASIASSHPSIARGADGQPLLSKETVVLISLNKRGSAKPSNVIIRGISPRGLTLRPQVKLTAGRMFRPGASEIIAGASIARRFEGAGIGETLRFGQREWTVVGLFDAGNSGFDSEIWGDADQLMPAFRRNAYSAMVLRLADTSLFDGFKKDIESDQRLTLDAKREQTFYSDQSKALSTFISVLGLILSIIFSIGAMIGATITMYASVANRVGEIGTLRALGFQRRSILAAFLAESMLLAVLGGALGLACASLMQFLSFSTTNFQSFSELAFGFRLTPAIVVKTLMFSLAMGMVGGFLPALRAARMKIVDALRAA
ncbi:ABC transporter permease [Duganella sp. BJB488]|uniref:ABC transporter permease n=1 Tax=unclassified Duganella TaxID=2636909 RepID=UPI000E347CFF|nr:MULTISPECIES: ABC transporter permease [unclassified Duganella]MCU6499456.1 ABC transporter permease [Rugamonas sp. A1-17]RFP20469.1 ABC transporter permease [Duganella sp. BJB489]RFP21092.1 ABC transporter permease [Duganella sp. BJB488]RFP33231.1 ABC transporter permease [Duganella sp. BJB480]